jgi:hypothetical protein
MSREGTQSIRKKTLRRSTYIEHNGNYHHKRTVKVAVSRRISFGHSTWDIRFLGRTLDILSHGTLNNRCGNRHLDSRIASYETSTRRRSLKSTL